MLDGFCSLLLRRLSGLVDLHVPLPVLLQPLEEALPVQVFLLQDAQPQT